jgi:hypothetical protein
MGRPPAFFDPEEGKCCYPKMQWKLAGTGDGATSPTQNRGNNTIPLF